MHLPDKMNEVPLRMEWRLSCGWKSADLVLAWRRAQHLESKSVPN